MLGCIPPAEAPRGRAFAYPGGDGGVGRDGDLPRAVWQAAGAPRAAQVFREMFLAAIRSGALGRIYGEQYQARLQVLLCRLVFGLSLFFSLFVPGPVSLVEFAGHGVGSGDMCR